MAKPIHKQRNRICFMLWVATFRNAFLFEQGTDSRRGAEARRSRRDQSPENSPSSVSFCVSAPSRETSGLEALDGLLGSQGAAHCLDGPCLADPEEGALADLSGGGAGLDLVGTGLGDPGGGLFVE